MDQAASSRTDDALCNDAREDLALLDDHGRVLRTLVVPALLEVDGLRDYQAQNLLARPERLRLEDGRLGQAPLQVVVDEHEDIHD